MRTVHRPVPERAPAQAVELARAAPEDAAVLLPLVMAFHQEGGLRVEAQDRSDAVHAILEGGAATALLALERGRAVGYAVLAYGYSIEYGGRDAFLDELYVEPDRRGQGIGRALVAYAERVAREDGARALHLEADHGNQPAADLYRSLGYEDHPRHLMTKRLR